MTCEKHEDTANTLRAELDQVSELLINSQQNCKMVRDDLTVLRYEKDTVDATLVKWKAEYAALAERYVVRLTVRVFLSFNMNRKLVFVFEGTRH